MTEPPYGRETPQEPKYCNDISWSGVPIFSKNYYLIKAQGTAQELLTLQNQAGVIDFPNIDADRLRDTPKARRTKNRLIFQKLGLNENEDLDVRQFINLCANSEAMHGWDKDRIILGGN
jgi:hypothetical protein